jgi:hypothetical protein
MRPSLRAAGILLAALAHTQSWAAVSENAPFAGRRVSDILAELSGATLHFVFSSSLVPESLLVLREPTVAAADPVQLVRQILAPHHLILQQLQPGLFAVVAGDPAPPAQPAVVHTAAPPEPLREVIVAASRYRIGAATTTPFELERDDLAGQPGVGDDPLRSLGRLPGVAQDGLSAQSNVRGGEANEVLLLLDGFPLRRAFHLSGYQSLFSVLDNGIVRSAEVFTGGYPARYGNRMAAVFDFHTVRSTDEPRHSLGVDFFNASARTAGAWSDTEYLASARVGTLSPLLGAFAPSVGDPRYSDAFLRLEHGTADGLRLSGNLLWARNELEIADRDTGEQAQFEDRLQYLWLRADHDFSSALSASVWLGQTTIQSFREGTLDNPGIASGEVRDRRSSMIWDLRSLLQWQPAAQHVVEAGLEFTQERAQYRYSAGALYAPAVQQVFGIGATVARVADLAPARRRSALFVAHRWQLTPTLTSEVGLRGQAVVSTGLEADWSIEPRLGLRWQFAPRTRLNLGWGRFYQADEAHELKIEDGLDNFPAAQRSDHLIVGIEHAPSDTLSLRAEFFSKRQTDPRARYENLLDRRTLLPEIAPDRVRVLPDSAELEGVEVSAEFRRDPWRGSLATSLAKAADETADTSTARSWDQTWTVNGSLRWERGRWSAGGSLVAHRGFPTTALSTSPAATLGARNGSHLPNYVQLDLRLQYSQPIAMGALVWSAELLNATDQPNQCCTELLLGPTGLYTQSLRGLPVFPSLGVRWNW